MPACPPAPTTASILIIDDDLPLAHWLDGVLREQGYKPTIAGDGEEGLRAVRENRYDVIVLDWYLPGLSGLDVLKSLAAEPHKPRIMVLTGRARANDIVTALAAGADDFLTKPFAMPDFLGRLNALLAPAV